MPVQLAVRPGGGARGRVEVPEYVVNSTPNRCGEPDVACYHPGDNGGRPSGSILVT